MDTTMAKNPTFGLLSLASVLADKASAPAPAPQGLMYAIITESAERPGRLCVLGTGKTSTAAWADAGAFTPVEIRRSRSSRGWWCQKFEASEWDAIHDCPAGAEYTEYDD